MDELGINPSTSWDANTTMRTEVGPLKSLIREPHLEPSAVFVLVKFCDCQARAIDSNRVAYVAISQYWCRVSDCERAASIVVLDR